jgi:radical SAM protein with 4Fe4S-binding SPASM domain
VDCPTIPTTGYGSFSQRIKSNLGNERYPLSGTFELNFRCNLRCKHCYVAVGHTGILGKRELEFAEIRRIVDEIVDEGCLWLLLTGGEPLFRKDFKDIYRYIKQKGLLVTLFTNGTLITPEIADFLQEYSPFNLEITLYGRTQETYESVTGIPGSYNRCMQGIDHLYTRGIHFGLKTMLLTLNAHELKDMQEFAQSLGARFRYDGLINSGIDGKASPVSYRLPHQKLIDIELEDSDRIVEYRRIYSKYKDQPSTDNFLYVCSAGLRSFHIDPYGELSLCMMARQASFNLRTGSFKDGWDSFLRLERRKPALKSYTCNQCKLLSICGQCPGWSYFETGVEDQPVPYLCQVAHLRASAFGLQ